MITPTSSINSIGLTADPQSALTQDQTQPNTQPASASVANGDTVTISPTAQAKALQQSGETVSEIATMLGMTTQMVDTDLGICTASSSNQPAASTPAVNASHPSSSK